MEGVLILLFEATGIPFPLCAASKGSGLEGHSEVRGRACMAWFLAALAGGTDF